MSRGPIPAGEVSSIRGRWQAPGLTWVVRVVVVLGIASLAPAPFGTIAATTAVAAVIAVPLLRVCWLILRWTQEDDRRFVAVSVGLLCVIALGVGLALAGVGA